MGNSTADPIDRGQALLDLYGHGVAEVYGDLLPRCGHPTTAEDLTSETFMAAVDMVKRHAVPSLTTARLIGVARPRSVRGRGRRPTRTHAARDRGTARASAHPIRSGTGGC